MLVNSIKVIEQEDGTYGVKVNGKNVATGISKMNIDFTVRPIKINVEYQSLSLGVWLTTKLPKAPKKEAGE
jgi:hypothetical protein